MRKEVVSIDSVLEAALETARPVIEAKHHSCEIDLPAQQVLLHADAMRLSQVFNNLLTNAAKYTDPRGKIWVTVAVQNGAAAISVRDTGMGLPAEALKTVFKMFSQLSATSERAQGGLGIGLALTRGLVELHGGTIEARSAGLGFGSEFIVHLPVLANARLEEAAPVAKDAPTPAARRVLLADDNVDAVDSLAVLLSLDGYDVKAAFDGEQALQIAESLRPDVCILDIGMPRMNGREVARRIRSEPWGERMVLVALTGWGKEEDAVAAKDAGIDHYCTKPVDPEKLSRWISAETRADKSRR